MQAEADAIMAASKTAYANQMYDTLALIGSQSVGPDYSPEQALSFCRSHAKDALHAVRSGQLPQGIRQADGMGAILSVMLQDVVGEYEYPDEVPEWDWIECNASYTHKDNGRFGVWEFMLNVARDFGEIPSRLAPIMAAAKECGAVFVLFHQGT